MLTLQFVPYADIEKLDTSGRINRLLDIVKEEKIVLMQGRLNPEEEILLIKQTMEDIHEGFKGVETCTIYPEEKDLQFFNKLKKEMVRALVGQRDGMTIIGPASVIKEIRRDPNKIQLFTVPSAVGGKSGKTRVKKPRSGIKKKMNSKRRISSSVSKTRRRR